jgi:type VI secretion system secreted protein Hcp
MRPLLLTPALIAAALIASGTTEQAQPAPTPPPIPTTPPTRPISTPRPHAPAAGPGQFTVQIEGAKQGRFKGEGPTDASKDRLIGLRFDYEVHLPRDEHGELQATGKRVHSPIVFAKEWGAASPQLFQAAATGETLKSVTFDFYAQLGGATDTLYTIRLTNARVASVRQYSDNGRFYEDVALLFDKIEVEHRPSKTMGSDEVTK